MAKPCRNKEDVINRMQAMYRLGRMHNFAPGLFPPELFGSKTKKTGELSIDDIVEGLPKSKFLITECYIMDRRCAYMENLKQEDVRIIIHLASSGNTTNIPNEHLTSVIMKKLEEIK